MGCTTSTTGSKPCPAGGQKTNNAAVEVLTVQRAPSKLPQAILPPSEKLAIFVGDHVPISCGTGQNLLYVFGGVSSRKGLVASMLCLEHGFELLQLEQILIEWEQERAVAGASSALGAIALPVGERNVPTLRDTLAALECRVDLTWDLVFERLVHCMRARPATTSFILDVVPNFLMLPQLGDGFAKTLSKYNRMELKPFCAIELQAAPQGTEPKAQEDVDQRQRRNRSVVMLGAVDQVNQIFSINQTLVTVPGGGASHVLDAVRHFMTERGFARVGVTGSDVDAPGKASFA